ncbi:MAG TPA: DNA translocase FtsK [Halothiobacillus sp.]|nr:DNA translocase FtsK [Halothiobacillus sp.]
MAIAAGKRPFGPGLATNTKLFFGEQAAPFFVGSNDLVHAGRYTCELGETSIDNVLMSDRKNKGNNSNFAVYHPARFGRELLLLMSLSLAAMLFVSLVTYSPTDPGWSTTGTGDQVNNAIGVFGAWLADSLRFLVGYGAYALPMGLILIALRIFWSIRYEQPFFSWAHSLQFGGFLLFVLTITILVHIHMVPPPPLEKIGAGGLLGRLLALPLVDYLGALGTTLILLPFIMIAITAMTGLSWLGLVDVTGSLVLGAWEAFLKLLQWFKKRVEWLEGPGTGANDESVPVIRRTERKGDRRDPVVSSGKESNLAKPSTAAGASPPAVVRSAHRESPPKRGFLAKRDKPKPIKKALDGEWLSLSLLDPAVRTESGYSEEALLAMSRLIEERLSEFGVEVTVVAAHPGPVITRFELEPAPGVKVSQISNLAKDLARALSTVSVRVIEVIPGKSTVGLEIPNHKREIIALREVLESHHYTDAKSPLTIGLGKDIGGEPVVADLARMPHLLVAGTTGSGKSVGINAMILSLLYKSTPEDVRLILIDPKMLELSVYEGIPHLLAPVVTDMKEAANALRWAVGEMERRYRMMAALGVRNIASANAKICEAREAGEPLLDPLYNPAEALDPDLPAPELEPLPYIVVVVDEFADMMMVVGKKVEELIARLAQKARAAGIHLILATQRPSVDVITGLIKANIPTRIAFQVSSKIDSRTILDQMGAEMLLGHGDMLYLPPGTAMPMRVHGAFVSDDEVHRVVEALKSVGEPDYIEDILDDQSGAVTLPGERPPAGESGERDELYDQAVAIVLESRKASISYIQRRLKIGYNRAARLVEEMENAGIVGPLQPNGSREVLVPPPSGS